ncbi:hypothetical protein ACFVYG_08680 [Streptomyces sp. NPDC058256]|uniref:hypothetical protein n=1 Tax=Streptomyces sp. NPDC058256 TaxID=3346408 RepID=UPI0036F0DEB1
MNIAERAAHAHELQGKRSTHPLTSDRCAADVARAASRLAALVGIDPEYVRPDHNWNYLHLPLVPLTLHASDPDDLEQTYTFSYRDPLYDDEPFFLIGPCPVCGRPVPLAEIRSLADLGAFLAAGPERLPDDGRLPNSYPDEFDLHPAHSSTCPFNGRDL